MKLDLFEEKKHRPCELSPFQGNASKLKDQILRTFIFRAEIDVLVTAAPNA